MKTNELYGQYNGFKFECFETLGESLKFYFIFGFIAQDS